MTRGTTAIAALITVVAAGCGSDESARRGKLTATGGPEYKIRRRPPATPRNDDMKLSNEYGVLEDRDVEDVLEQHFPAVRACYERAGEAQKYAAGKVLLRFFIAGDGRTDDVLVIESGLGSYDVERCLVEVGRGIRFRAPKGRRATTFDYPVEFRSSQQVAVQEIQGVKIEKELADLIPQLAECGAVADNDVDATMYIESKGKVGSVGLASPTVMDEAASDCMVQTIRQWRMGTALPGRILRFNFTIPPTIAELATAKRSYANASTRRRRP